MCKMGKYLLVLFLHIFVPEATYILPLSIHYFGFPEDGCIHTIDLIKIRQAIIVLCAKDVIFANASWLTR